MPPVVRWFRRLRVPLVGLVLAAVGASGCVSDEPSATHGPEPAVALAGVVREPALQVAHVTLPDVEGATTTMRAADGDLLLVYFGYVSCPDVCPMTMSDIRVAIEALPPDLADRVAVAMVTVDPDRDRPDVLTGYLGHFFDRSVALRTEDPAELASAARAFGVQYEVEDHEPGDTAYGVAHTGVTYVVDDTGTVVVEWPFGFEHQHMADDLESLLTIRETT